MSTWTDELHFVARRGDIEEAKALLEAGYPPNQFDDIVRTPGGLLRIAQPKTATLK